LQVKDKIVEAKKNLTQDIGLVNNRLNKEIETLKSDFGINNKQLAEKLKLEIDKSAARLAYNFKELITEEEKQRNAQIVDV